VGLVDDDDRVLGQQKVALDFAKQNTVGHEPKENKNISN
jgi:hypothetical protein